MAELTLNIKEPGKPERTVEAVAGLTLGRHPTANQCVLSDETVSGRHADIVDVNGQLAIQDVGSNNGTVADGVKLTPRGNATPLRPGMQIKLGRVQIDVVGQAEDATMQHVDLDATMQNVAEDERTMVNPAGEVEEATIVNPQAAPAPPPPPPPQAPPTPPPPQPPVVHQQTATESGTIPRKIPAQPGESAEYSSAEIQTLLAAGGSGMDIGLIQTLDAMNARLIVLNEADRRTIPIRTLEFRIGREAGLECSLANQGVSTTHARIVFHNVHNSFVLEDLGSANGTLLMGVPLAQNMARELDWDSYVRFGPIEALFLKDKDADLEPRPRWLYENAARLLVRQRTLTEPRLRSARQVAAERGISLAEALVLEQAVSPKEWSKAVQRAEILGPEGIPGGGGVNRKLLIVVGAVIVLVVLLWALLGGGASGPAEDGTPETPSESE